MVRLFGVRTMPEIGTSHVSYEIIEAHWPSGSVIIVQCPRSHPSCLIDSSNKRIPITNQPLKLPVLDLVHGLETSYVTWKDIRQRNE